MSKADRDSWPSVLVAAAVISVLYCGAEAVADETAAATGSGGDSTAAVTGAVAADAAAFRSEEHTSELQSP